MVTDAKRHYVEGRATRGSNTHDCLLEGGLRSSSPRRGPGRPKCQSSGDHGIVHSESGSQNRSWNKMHLNG